MQKHLFHWTLSENIRLLPVNILIMVGFVVANLAIYPREKKMWTGFFLFSGRNIHKNISFAFASPPLSFSLTQLQTPSLSKAIYTTTTEVEMVWAFQTKYNIWLTQLNRQSKLTFTMLRPIKIPWHTSLTLPRCHHSLASCHSAVQFSYCSRELRTM